MRKLPARVVVYLALTVTLFEKCGYQAASRKLSDVLEALSLPMMIATALWRARTRLGVRSMRALFDQLRGPASAIRTAGTRWAGLLAVAIDGTCLDVADDGDVRTRLGKGANHYPAASDYPQVLLVALVACGPGRSSTRSSARATPASPSSDGVCCARCTRAWPYCWTGDLPPTPSHQGRPDPTQNRPMP
ncbi:hypothetical protein FCH28_15880 [Streptomyces piniterrae]|uniref:Transposase IS4 N-terminal domain-containing protein n=1 Tax=Streptomyces piniterrae TaxID=2571125 RepID=A0A4U0NLB2_9ACTN|nr:transposase domain-containing protein [Streptomyces piniterrae]TJZ54572.1 hypothetical protein FCH28_15880 [Streptomyces piniterrae]